MCVCAWSTCKECWIEYTRTHGEKCIMLCARIVRPKWDVVVVNMSKQAGAERTVLLNCVWLLLNNDSSGEALILFLAALSTISSFFAHWAFEETRSEWSNALLATMVFAMARPFVVRFLPRSFFICCFILHIWIANAVGICMFALRSVDDVKMEKPISDVRHFIVLTINSLGFASYVFYGILLVYKSHLMGLLESRTGTNGRRLPIGGELAVARALVMAEQRWW